MMEQADDGIDCQVAQATQPVIAPSPPVALAFLGRDLFPEQGVAKGFNAKPGDAVQVLDTAVMAIERQLVEITVADAVDRLAPEIEPALRYTLAPPSEAAPGHTEDTQ